MLGLSLFLENDRHIHPDHVIPTPPTISSGGETRLAPTMAPTITIEPQEVGPGARGDGSCPVWFLGCATMGQAGRPATRGERRCPRTVRFLRECASPTARKHPEATCTTHPKTIHGTWKIDLQLTSTSKASFFTSSLRQRFLSQSHPKSCY